MCILFLVNPQLLPPASPLVLRAELGLAYANLALYHGDNSFSLLYYRNNMRVTLEKYTVYLVYISITHIPL